MSLRHVLMTRFNMPTGGREVAFRARPGWLEERVELFARVCLPSVARQDEQRFDWIVYFDRDSPAWLPDRVEDLRALRDFHPCYTALFDARGWARTVREVIGAPQPDRWIATSNLDNDDALAADYMARLRRKAELAIGERHQRFAINLPDGYVLAGDRLFAHRHPHNAFTNLIEPDDAALETTMSIRHMELADHVPVLQVEGAPAWVQFVHGGNVSNRVRGNRVAPPTADGRFDERLFAGVVAPTRSTVAIERWARGPLRRVRDRLSAAVRKILPVRGD